MAYEIRPVNGHYQIFNKITNQPIAKTLYGSAKYKYRANAKKALNILVAHDKLAGELLDEIV